MNRRHPREGGFNLLELLVSVFIMSIVLATGVPSLQTFLATNRMAAAANDLISGINAARAEAIKRNQPGAQAVTFCASANWNAANPACDLGGANTDGWIVFVDQNANLNVDAGDTVVQRHAPLTTNNSIVITRDANTNAYLQFGPNGFPRRPVGAAAPISNLQLCDSRGNRNTGGGVAAGRWISVPANGPGRPQLYRMQADVNGPNNPLGGC
jgi:type IV fimbrial biogenesis protein FimT